MFTNLLLKLNMFLNIGWIFVVYKVFTCLDCRKKNKRCESNDIIESANLAELNTELSSSVNNQIDATGKDDPSDGLLSVLSQLKIGFLKIYKLNFTSTALILLQLVHCERIHDQLHLYVFADQLCYVWWQWIILAVGLPILAMFPLSFGMALDQLKAQAISTDTFVVSCVIPFSFFIIKKFHKVDKEVSNNEEEKCRTTILEVEEMLFDAESKGIRWPVIQYYRMLVIVLVNTMLLNPVFKSLCFSVIFIGFWAHDWYRMPFENPFLNYMQRLTSACLFLVNVCSVPSAFSSVGNILLVPNMKICLEILRYFELSLYIIILLFFSTVENVGKISKTNRNAERKQLTGR